jgi:hypothetical protein
MISMHAMDRVEELQSMNYETRVFVETSFNPTS